MLIQHPKLFILLSSSWEIQCHTRKTEGLIYENVFIFLVVNIAVDFPCSQREHIDLHRWYFSLSMHTERCFTHSFSVGPVAGLGWEDNCIWLDRKSYFKGVRISKSLSHILVSQLEKCSVIPKLLRLFRTGIWIWYAYKTTQFKTSCAFREEGAFRAITSNISRVVSADYLFANFSSTKPL